MRKVYTIHVHNVDDRLVIVEFPVNGKRRPRASIQSEQKKWRSHAWSLFFFVLFAFFLINLCFSFFCIIIIIIIIVFYYILQHLLLGSSLICTHHKHSSLCVKTWLYADSFITILYSHIQNLSFFFFFFYNIYMFF